MNIALMRDIGAHLATVAAYNPIVLNAGTTAEDNAEINGFSVDRELVNPSKSLQLSCQSVVQYSYSLAAAATIALKFNLQDSASSGGTYADYDDIKGSTVQSKTVGSTGSTASQSGNGVLRGNFDLSGAKRFVRMQVTATFTGTSTGSDDLDVGGVMVLGGYDTVPASTS